ncbi:hypothetical protein C5167_026375 [Papaver somniferum]|uniref:uncharacterized protein LOC113326719 n=1 Tax=Papaver somniferum TaxID=3469 RepID=UPI000E6F7899|nr:uncharacterized protein LOC113326719 [Papaver somniferum]RZC85706.1 hypothetical protein C5167_026375 [Papaver somniferum]
MAAWMTFARTVTGTTSRISHQMVSSANQSSKPIQRRELCNLASGKDPHGPPKEKSYAGYKFCGAVIYIGFWGNAIFGEVPKKKKKFKIVTVNNGVRDRRAIVEYRSFYHFGF